MNGSHLRLSDEKLIVRASYGGRKGRRALQRYMKHNKELYSGSVEVGISDIGWPQPTDEEMEEFLRNYTETK